MSPSAAQAIQHGVNGYLALGMGGWYHGLKKLAESSERRREMGLSLYSDFQRNIAPDVLNRRLVEFLRHLPAAPSSLPFSTEEREIILDSKKHGNFVKRFLTRAKRYFSDGSRR